MTVQASLESSILSEREVICRNEKLINLVVVLASKERSRAATRGAISRSEKPMKSFEDDYTSLHRLHRLAKTAIRLQREE